jgi:hypothetical protein
VKEEVAATPAALWLRKARLLPFRARGREEGKKEEEGPAE